MIKNNCSTYVNTNLFLHLLVLLSLILLDNANGLAFKVKDQTSQHRRVLITPPPEDKVKESEKKRKCISENEEDTDEDGTPNWMFLYPKPCSCLFPTQGASVGSVKEIPPDSCIGGYYGHASLDPEQVIEEGLPKRGNDWDLLSHANQVGNSAFRGTTNQITYPDGNGAASWAGEGGYVYELTCVPSWDVNKHLQGRVFVSDWAVAVGKKRYVGNTALGEHEFAVSSLVPRYHIKRYGRVVESVSGLLYVPRNMWTDNPNWDPEFCKYSVSNRFCVESK